MSSADGLGHRRASERPVDPRAIELHPGADIGLGVGGEAFRACGQLAQVGLFEALSPCPPNSVAKSMRSRTAAPPGLLGALSGIDHQPDASSPPAAHGQSDALVNTSIPAPIVRFAPDDRRRIEVLTRASELAMRRLRGDDAFRLMVDAAERAEQAGDGMGAARRYAIAVEFATRLGGISGRFEEPHLRELLARAERLAPEPEPDVGARMKLDRAWIDWSFGRPGEMAEPVAEGLELARDGDDVLLLSCALDAASATSWWASRFAEVEALNHERLEVLERAPQSQLVAVERNDAISMITESMIRTGRFREAVQWDELNAKELGAVAPHIAGARSVHAMYLLGEWDQAIERGNRVRENWVAEGQPPFVPFAPDLATVATIHGLRGEDAEHRDWAALAEEVAGTSQQLPGVRMLEAEVALHFGEIERAVRLIDVPWPGFWWQEPVLARRAEILAIAGREDALDALERAEARPAGDPFSTAVALRGRAVITGSDAPLREALEIFERIECPYESARTRWILGGADRDTAREAFERLGAVV